MDQEKSPLTNSQDTSTTPSLENLLNAVGNPRCCLVLLTVDEDGSVSLDDLKLRGDNKEQIMAELKETHLTHLADAGYVDWDRENAVISKGPKFDEIKPHLDNWTGFHL